MKTIGKALLSGLQKFLNRKMDNSYVLGYCSENCRHDKIRTNTKDSLVPFIGCEDIDEY